MGILKQRYMNEIIQLNSEEKLSEHFTLGEMTKSSHSNIYNVPTHEAIYNLKNLCKWPEVLRERSGGPVRINSGYRSPQLNKKVGGVPTSNHLTGCAADIRVADMEQLIRYAAILLDYADETGKEFDELLLERNRFGAFWLHFAVKPKGNRHKVLFISV